VYLLDTNHCSQIMDGNLKILNRLQENSDRDVGMSVITRGELFFMVEKSERQTENLEKVTRFVEAINIYRIDDPIADCYGQLKGKILKHFGPKKDKSKRSKITIQKLGFSDNDLWIVATAISYGMTLISADKDFVRIQEVQHLSLDNWNS
jgi:tRNA(fMet)-specific endonuclease VapC